MVVLNSHHRSKVKGQGQGHRDGILLFESTVISQKLSHRKISIFFHRHLFGYSIQISFTSRYHVSPRLSCITIHHLKYASFTNH